ncbi:hypothetical protein HGRIS_013003 [Hohenbuehelia grisea]|uniref:DNA damage-binding protein CMR1 n=1 Tax=Hohenbuehelia grisea TaxID=104357 RepID=A0ABR3IU21_9AGAR
MPPKSQYELDREANIARNRALLEQLELKQAVASLGMAAKPAPPPKTTAKPIQPKVKRPKKEKVEAAEAPRRQSSRLTRKGVVNPDETPAQKRKREAEEEERRAKEAEERLEAEERERQAKRPRHEELDLQTLAAGEDADDLPHFKACLKVVTERVHPRGIGDIDAYDFEDESKDQDAVAELREKLQNLKVVARAKVTQDRVYSAAYHPEPTKDLIFFGDKHGQLGIWDARAPSEEVADEDGDVVVDDKEGGRYWRLQAHWPATSKSSISCVKFDPVDSHSVYTTSYDGTIRTLSFTSGISREIFSVEETLISSIDLTPTGHEMWISDALGGVTHLDLREDKSKARWYGLSDQKIGCLSINPVQPHFMLTASNSRSLKIWDIRKFQNLAQELTDPEPLTPPSSPGGPEKAGTSTSPAEVSSETVNAYIASTKGKGCMRSEWRHDKSVSSAYWDPRGRGIVSTSYDDTLRLWDVKPSWFKSSSSFPTSRPFSRIRHNCQTGKWLTILRAQWSPNPDVYPHFTIGNMDHSLDIFSCKVRLGDYGAYIFLISSVARPRVTSSRDYPTRPRLRPYKQ